MNARVKRALNADRLLAVAVLGAICAAPAVAATITTGTNNNSVSRPVAEASSLTPRINTSVANARVIIADGTANYQPITVAPAETRWFAFEAEPGKTYVVDILDPFDDLGTNVIGAVTVTDSGGSAAPPEANTNCGAAATNRAPGLEVNSDGWRCIIRTFAPGIDGVAPWNQNKRGIFIGVSSGAGNSFELRVREATMYSRWSTNGYDFHIELQNTTADSMCAQIDFYPATGLTYSGVTWTVPPSMQSKQVTVPALGAVNQTVLAGTASGGALTGPLRITDCGTGELVPGALNISSYAFNPVTHVYLFYSGTKANQGGQNSW